MYVQGYMYVLYVCSANDSPAAVGCDCDQEDPRPAAQQAVHLPPHQRAGSHRPQRKHGECIYMYVYMYIDVNF